MKKLSLSLLTLALASTTAWAAPVTRQKAEQVASQYLSGVTGQRRTPQQVLTAQGAYYVVNMAPQGWVIVAADDNAAPIIGFNATGAIQWHSMPDNLRWFLGEAREAVSIQAAQGRTNARWASVSSMSLMSRSSDEGSVEPLIPVNWDQGAPYNTFCPKDGDKTSYVGCVAVAMAQAMSVQKWPTSPQGEMSYGHRLGTQSINYDNEPAYDWELMVKNPAPKTKEAKDAVARLLRHTGVSVRMDYSASGSGIPSNDAQRISTALVKYFGYNANDIRCTYKYAGYSRDDQGWKQLIYNELDAGRAVVYNAISAEGGGRDAGHSFNVDGYRADGLYHLNWGWGGSSNGYFDLLVLSVSGYKYNKNQVVITGIGGQDRELRTLTLSDNVIDENLPAGTVVGLVNVNGEAPKPEYTMTVTGDVLKGGGGFQTVPFEVQGQYLVTTQPLRASDYAGPVVVKIKARTPAGESLNGTFTVSVVKERTIASATNFKYDRATGRVDMRSKHGVTWELRSAQGAVVGQGSMDPLPYATLHISQPGQYVLEMRDARETKTVTINK